MGATLFGAHPLIRRVNSLISRANEALKGCELQAAVPSLVSPVGPGNYVFREDLLVAIGSLRAGLEEILAQEGDEAESLRREVEALTSKLAEVETRSLNIVDDELRDRSLDLIVRPGKADAAVREACVLLEDRLREVSRLPAELVGVQLVSRALSPDSGVLILSDVKAEQDGIHTLYRGVIGFFKNPTSHRIIEDYDVTRARQIVGLVDLLLQLLREAKRRETGAESAEAATR